MTLPTGIVAGNTGHISHHNTIHALLNPVDAPFALRGIDVDTLANLPAAGVSGRQFLSSDFLRLLTDNGSRWVGPEGTRLFYLDDYLAVGDGVTDDSSEVQACIAAAAAVKGRVVGRPGATYVVEGITFPTDPWELDLHWATFLLKPGSTAHLVSTEGFDALVTADLGDGQWRFRMRRCIFDGNKANCPSGGDVVRFYGWAPVWDGVIVVNGKGKGIRTAWGPDVGGSDAVVNEMSGRFVGVLSIGNDGVDWSHAGPHDSKFIGCGVVSGGGGGMEVVGHGDGAHFAVFDAYNDSSWGLRVAKSATGYDMNVSGAGQVLLCDTGAGRCDFIGVNAAAVGAGTAGVVLKSQYHHIQGVIQNCDEDGLVIDGASGCQLELKFSNCKNAIKFANDQGGHQITASVATAAGQTTYTTPNPISASDLIFLRADGGGTNTSLIQIPNSIVGKADIFAQHNTAGQVALGAAGPGGESGVSFGAGNVRLYKDGTGTMRTNAAVLTFDGYLRLLGPSGPIVLAQAGAPGALVSPKGSLYLRTDGGVGTTMYVSQGGGTWNAVAGV